MSEINGQDRPETYNPDMVTVIERSDGPDVAVITRKNLTDFAMKSVGNPTVGARAGLMIDIQFRNRSAGKNYGLAPYIYTGVSLAESGYYADRAGELYEQLMKRELSIPGVGSESIALLGQHCVNLYRSLT